MISPSGNKRSNIFIASLYILLIALYTLVAGIPCFAITLFQPRGEANYWFIRKWAALLLWTCGVKLDVTGLENIPADGPFILMSTHNSHFDIPVLMKTVPRQFRIVAKKILFKIPLFGWIMSAAGYVSVDRGDRAQAFASLDKAAESVKAGMPLLIFPEGTRSSDGKLGEFKKGGFFLAIKAGSPIVPVIVDGTFNVLPKTTVRINPGFVKVTFCRPIDTASYTFDTKENLMENVRAAMLGRSE